MGTGVPLVPYAGHGGFFHQRLHGIPLLRGQLQSLLAAAGHLHGRPSRLLEVAGAVEPVPDETVFEALQFGDIASHRRGQLLQQVADAAVEPVEQLGPLALAPGLHGHDPAGLDLHIPHDVGVLRGFVLLLPRHEAAGFHDGVYPLHQLIVQTEGPAEIGYPVLLPEPHADGHELALVLRGLEGDHGRVVAVDEGESRFVLHAPPIL